MSLRIIPGEFAGQAVTIQGVLKGRGPPHRAMAAA